MSDNSNKPGIGKRSGEFLLYAIFVVCDAWGFWGESHVLCLAVAWVGFLGLLLYDGMPWDRMRFQLAAGLVACEVIYNIAPATLPAESDTHGWLSPADDPTPENACTHDPWGPLVPSDAMVFIAGTNGAWTVEPGKSTVLKIDGTPFISAERNGSRLAIDADVFGDDAKLVARVIRNEFHLVATEYSYRERSEDRSTLKVFDPTGQEVLYIRYLNPHAVVIRGRFVTPEGNKAIISDQGISGTNISLSGFCTPQMSEQRVGFEIQGNIMMFHGPPLIIKTL